MPLDDALAEAVEELRARQADEEGDVEELQEAEASRTPRVESALPVREIQARLRQGRTVQDVAKAAGVEPGWVERFAAPVFAEQAQVIRKVRSMALRRARLGPSSHAIGDAVRYNLAERGVALSPEEFASAWTTRQLADGRWAVRFGFRHRNKDQVLRFDVDETTGAVAAADRSSGQLGYVAPRSSDGAAAPQRLRPAKPGGEVRPTAKRATVTTGFRPDASATKAVSRPARERERASLAMRKAAAKRAAEAEKAATRKAKEKQEAAARRERAAKAEEARTLRERAAAEKSKAAAARKKAAATKRAAAEKARHTAAKLAAAQAKRAEAALVGAEKAKAAERAAAKKAAAKKITGKKTATKKAAATPSLALAPRASTPVRTAPVAPADQVPIVVRDERRDPLRPAARALFRAGLVEPVADEPTPSPTNGSAPPVGVAPPRSLDRPRPTRPLRAT